MRYSVEIDKAAIAEAHSLLEFVGGNAKDATRIAVNRTARQARTSTKALQGGGASQRIRKQIRLKAGYVNERLKLSLASKSNLSASIKVPSRGLLLSRYSTDGQISGDKVSWLKPPPMPPRGARVKVRPGGSTDSVGGDPGSFYMVLPKSKRLAIVWRRRTPGPRGGKIKVHFGPSISQAFSDVREEMEPEVEGLLQKEMLDAVDYLIRRKVPVEE